jgi:Mn-dependent DtxR family transcriptional regulator
VTITLGATEISLEDSQRAYLKHVRDYMREHRISPSYKDLSDLMDRGKCSARFAVGKLIKKGLLERGPGTHRNLLITELGYVVLSRIDQVAS